MADRLDIARFKAEQGLLNNKGLPSQAVAAGIEGLLSGIDKDVQAKRETRQAFKEEGASDIRDLRSLRAEAEAAGATDDKSSSGQGIKLGDIPTSTTLANWTLSQLDGFIQDSYDQQEVVTSGLGGPFAVRDYGIFKNNQKQTWQAVKGRADAAAAELEQTKKNAQGYTNDEGVFVPPTAGAGEAAFQRYQSIIGDLNNTRVRSGEDGMGIVEVYETVYDPATGVQKRVLDEDDNPIINKNVSGTSVMALMNKENSRWQKTDVIGAVDKSFGEDIIASYEVSINHPGYIKGSSREDNIRRNPSFTRYQDTFIEKTLPNNRAVSSTLTDNYNGQFYQLDPNQSVKGDVIDPKDETKKTGYIIDGKYLENLDETVTVQVLTGYDSNGKPIYESKSAPKYITSKVEGDGIVVQTTDEHKAAASGIVRGAIDGKIGKGIEAGVPVAQFDPYRASKVASKDRENKGVDLFKQITRSYDGEGDDVKNAVENLMISSGFKFNETISDKDNDGTVLSQTYQVDKGDGTFKSFKVTLQNPNPKWNETLQKGKKKGDDGYQPKYIPISKSEYEDKMYELFKGSDDNISVSEARKNYSGNKKNKYSPTGTFNAEGDRNMAVETTENVDVAEIPEVTANSAIGEGKDAVSAVEFVMNSEGFSDLQANWIWNGANTREIDQMGDSLKSAFAELAKGQGANQGGDISFVTNGTKIDVMNGDTVVDSIEFDLNEKSTLKQAITTALDAATKAGLPGRASGTRKKKSIGGNEVFQNEEGVDVDELGIPIEK